MNEIKENKKEKKPIILVGTKVDISFEEGNNFADNNNIIFYETSVKNKINIDNIFNSLFSLIIKSKVKVPCERYFLPITSKLANKFYQFSIFPYYKV